ncbi:HEAT repeat-containing protein [Amycolatopsis pretoriensis]|uniref:HEAT repeat-containing protein n=1 Tax=Amycolatopsis pretoriensis TaxID=218821 RepID=A0A1H5Q1N5_9PSEU|nr:HEAT repeat domain-containing protein [Amycolatopsis pretoriensis]SEF19849.1 HEAT repeat-containing protein [Amycolatopsis pretoriensis]
MAVDNAVRLVPRVADPFEETMALIDRLGWVPSANSSDELVEWQVPGGGTVVRWVVDGDTGVQFFVVEGPDRERVAGEIASSIDMLDAENSEHYLSRSDDVDWVMRGLYAVAAAAPDQHDQRIVDLLTRHMESPRPLIRRAALLATAITGWAEFVEPVSRFTGDPDPAVRDAAEAALHGLTSGR